MSFECLAFCTNQLPTGRPPYTADLSQLLGSKTRFLSHYIDAPNAALFPFGFGLSYTTFSSGRDALAQHHRSKGSDSNRHITSGGNTTAMNTGKLAATEVVQCYIGNREASLEQPVPQDRIAQDGASVCLPSRRCTMEDWRRSVHTIFTPLREFHGVFFGTLERRAVYVSNCKYKSIPNCKTSIHGFKSHSVLQHAVLETGSKDAVKRRNVCL